MRVFVERLRGSCLKRAFDLILAFSLLVIFIAPLMVIALLIKATSPGPILYWSSRIGKDNTTFRMPKLRTMRVGTPAMATHLLKDPETHLSPIGSFLRKNSLDE